MSAVELFAVELLKVIIAAAPSVIEAIGAVKAGNGNGSALHKQVADILDPALKDLQDANDIFEIK